MGKTGGRVGLGEGQASELSFEHDRPLRCPLGKGDVRIRVTTMPTVTSWGLAVQWGELYNYPICTGHKGFPGGSVVKNPPVNAEDTGDVGLIRGSGRFPGGGNGNQFQYSCWDNPKDRRVWWAAVQGVAKSWTWLSNWAHAEHVPGTWCTLLQIPSASLRKSWPHCGKQLCSGLDQHQGTKAPTASFCFHLKASWHPWRRGTHMESIWCWPMSHPAGQVEWTVLSQTCSTLPKLKTSGGFGKL